MKENRLICEDCTSIDEKLLKKCEKCAELYCEHNSSDVDARYCYNCLSDVTLKMTNVVREVRRVNPTSGKETVVPIKIATEYQFEGTDWLYMMQKIKDFASDPNGDFKFTKMIEYHKALYGLMISYREDARQAKIDKLRSEGSVVRIPGIDNGETTKVVSSTIHSPEAQARKRIVAVLRLTLGREPSLAEIENGMRAFGLSI